MPTSGAVGAHTMFTRYTSRHSHSQQVHDTAQATAHDTALHAVAAAPLLVRVGSQWHLTSFAHNSTALHEP